jgi:peptidoglycan glycosyltransferase
LNTHLRRSFYLFTLGFVALVGVLAYWQVYARESLVNNPANSLQSRRAQEAPRGLVLAGDGETVLAQSEPYETETGTRYRRVYPEGPVYAGVVGYWSQKYDAAGVEVGLNSELSGAGEPETLDELVNQVTGGPGAGNNVELTLDPGLQRQAYEELANSETGRGAIVALDPRNGEVLALATHPTFDPNTIDQTLPQLSRDEDAPLLNRATQALYPPGSSFKVVTAAAALEAGVRPTDRFVDTGEYEHRGYTVVNYGDAVYGPVDFTRALELSINTVFARIAVERVGREALYEEARQFGFGDSYEGFPIEVVSSRLGEGDLAQIAFGQDTVEATVFEMSLVASAVANDGKLMDPRLVREVRSPDGLILDRPTPRVRDRVLDEETANTLGRMMVGVVEEGSAQPARIPGIEVAGKTGTAENSQGKPHSWFIAYAPAEDPQIALAVLVENAGDGEEEAVPIARRLISTYLADRIEQQNPEGTDGQGQPGGATDGLPFENPFEGNPMEGTPFGGGGQ